ncbi:unnamed protein product [Rhizophagus irregularis]|nr:unnamed protein product [Rhizophagus irregularis]
MTSKNLLKILTYALNTIAEESSNHQLGPHDNVPTKETPVPHEPDNTSFGTYKFPHSRQYNDNVTIITPQDRLTDAPHFSGSFTHDTPTMANTSYWTFI